MVNRLYRFIYFRLLGWKTRIDVPAYDKCVICGAPHTSNWDLLYGKLFCGMWRSKVHFLMKKEWFFFPLGPLFRALGGIPVDRGRNVSLTDQLARRFRESRTLRIAVTPEGTRRANPDWKKGFYYIALKAQVPILLVGIDYPTRTIACEKCLMPSGNYDEDIRTIKEYFTRFRGKKPQNFAL